MESEPNNTNISNTLDSSKIRVGKSPSISIKIPSHVVGIIDCSGSMSSRFVDLSTAWNFFRNSIGHENVTTVLFSSESRLLDGDLGRKHCGGTTNILSGFKLAIEQIDIMANKGLDDFTIIFISDGQDNNTSTIQKRVNDLIGINPKLTIKVICMGVGMGFPTFISMDLRKKFHNGTSAIPPVFLVYAEEQEEAVNTNQFDTTLIEIKNNFVSIKKSYPIKPAVRRFLWDKETEKVNQIYENEYFFVYENVEEIFYNDTHRIETTYLEQMDLDQTFELLKIITPDLQIKGMRAKVKNEAAISYEILSKKCEQLKSLNKLLGKDWTNTPKTLKERLAIKKEKSAYAQLDNLLAELKSLKIGESLLDLSEAEAAKRLAIGTKTGKFHAKALQFRGVDNHMFSKYREEFKKILEEHKLVKESTQENSFILLQNQKEILMEPDLINQIDTCSIYNLLDLIPMVGQTVLIKISDSSMINPFNLNVVYIPKINKTCDLYSISNNQNEMEISIGNDETEKFNAVLPLFDEKDKDLKPFISSKFFHLLMTFNCMRNLDTIFLDAYLALMSNFFVKVVKFPAFGFKDELINKLGCTVEMVYGGDPILERTIDILKSDSPRNALMNECKELNHKCENVSKIIFALMIMKNRNLLNKEKYSELIEYIIIEHVGRMIKGKESKEYIEFYSGPEIPENYRVIYNDENNDLNQENKEENTDLSVNGIIEKFKESTNEKNTDIKSLKQNFKNFFNENYKLENFINPKKMNIKLKLKFFNMFYIKTNFAFFFDFQELICGKDIPLNESIFWIAVNHNMKYEGFDERNLKDIDRSFPNIRDEIKEKLLESNIKKQLHEAYDNSLKTLIEEFNKDFIEKLNNIHQMKLTTEILKRKATYNQNFANKNVMFLGYKNSGKSSLIGKLMQKLDLIDHDLFKYYIQESKKIFPERENFIPYAWISDTDADERINEYSTNTNISYLNHKENFIKIFDTPGKFKNFNSSLKDFFLIDNFFIVIEGNRKLQDFENMDKINFIKNQLKFIYYGQNVKYFNLLLTKFDNMKEYDFRKNIVEINIILEEVIKKENLKDMKFTITPVSINNDLNITECNFLQNENNSNLNLSKKSLLDLLIETKEKDAFSESFIKNKQNFHIYNQLNEFNFSGKQEKNDKEFLSEIENISKENKIIPFGCLLGRKTNKKLFNNKLIYTSVISGKVKKNDILLILPSLKKYRVDSININYNEVQFADEGEVISLMLNDYEEDDLGLEANYLNKAFVEHGTTIKVFDNKNELIEFQDNFMKKFLKINKTNVDVKKITLTAEILPMGKLKKNKNINVVYNGYEISMILMSMKNTDDGKCLVEMFTLGNDLILNEFWNRRNNSTFIIKGKHYNIDAVGKIIEII